MSERNSHVAMKKAPTAAERQATRRRRQRIGGTLAALVGVGGGIVAGAQVDLFGVTFSARTDAQTEAVARKHYNEAFRSASDSEKYTMQFLSTSEYYANIGVGGKGLLGIVTGKGEHTYEIGQTCLTGSAYDVSPNKITGWAANGKTQTLAGVVPSPTNPDQIAVYSGNPGLPPLVFNGADGDKLLAADAATKAELTTYGCEDTAPSTLIP